MLHPDTELRFVDSTIGYGVFATRLIPRGTITWVRDRLDQAFTPEAIAAFPTHYRDTLLKYTFIDARGHFVLCWDLARFINHSCDATCRSAGYEFELAVRDIHPGDELTDDYGSLNLDCDFPCSCGTPECRGVIRPRDLLQYADAWDRDVADPFRLIPRVAQPLWPFCDEQTAIMAALEGRTPIASVRANYVEVPPLSPPGSGQRPAAT
jgi:hypothetical protein